MSSNTRGKCLGIICSSFVLLATGLVVGNASAQAAKAQGKSAGIAPLEGWRDKKTSPGQIEIPQDRDMAYYADNVYTLWVDGKDPKQVQAEWKQYLTKNLVGGYCFDLRKIPLADRPMGDKGAVLDVGGKAQMVNIVQIAPGKTTEWHSFGFMGEPLFYIVDGQGTTEYYSDAPPWKGGMPLKTYTWQKESLIALPPDHHLRHTNTGTTPVLMLQVVGYGVNLVPYVTEERRSGVENPNETSEARTKMLQSGGTYELPFFKDLRELKLALREERGDSSGFFDVSNTAGHKSHPNIHVSQLLRDKTFAHKHDGRPIFVILQGHGHDLWSPANTLEEFKAAVASGQAHTANYSEGSVCGIPVGPHWHQHFGEDPNVKLRYLAIVPRMQSEPPPGVSR